MNAVEDRVARRMAVERVRNGCLDVTNDFDLDIDDDGVPLRIYVDVDEVRKQALADVVSCLPTADEVGTTEYRAVHEVLVDMLALDAPSIDMAFEVLREVARIADGMANDIDDYATGNKR